MYTLKDSEPEEKKVFWSNQVELGRVLAKIIKRDPDYSNPRYQGLKKIVDGVTEEEQAQIKALSTERDGRWDGFAPIPCGKKREVAWQQPVLSHTQYSWKLLGDRLEVVFVGC